MQNPFRSIFTPTAAEERRRNFEDYLGWVQGRDGELLEAEQDLAAKRETLAAFRANPVRSRFPLRDPDAFHRNHLVFTDELEKTDPKILLLTCIYKFARHEWVGISAAWEATPRLAEARTTNSRITRYHLAEEFCHIRYFEEIFRVFDLDGIVWVPLGPLKQRLYRLFAGIPASPIKDALAFVTELLGVMFYRQLDRALDALLDDEPEARDRVRALLYEITADEIGHIGLRRNYLGAVGIRVARRLVPPFFRAFVRDMPESPYLLQVDRMVEQALIFDYSVIPTGLLARTWIPSYCRISGSPSAGVLNRLQEGVHTRT